jgi:hypothetical protein
MFLDEKILLKFIKRTIEFPYPQICKHLVASNLLSIMEENGFDLSQELAKAVINADDDKSIDLINCL